MKREHMLRVRMSDAEMQRLDGLVNRFQVPASDIVRGLIDAKGMKMADDKNDEAYDCRQRRWTVVIVDRPTGEHQFVTENEMWQFLVQKMSEAHGVLVVEKVEICK